MKADIVEKMDKAELHRTAKKFGIKYGKLSLMQIREALINAGDEPPNKEKKQRAKQEGPRPGSKMEKAVMIYSENKDKPRKEILKLFQDRVKLTKAGSNTYFAIIKKKMKESKL